MRTHRLPAQLSLAALALAVACVETPSSSRDPVRPPSPVALPSGLVTCDVLGATDGGQSCRIYDTASKSFSDEGDGTPEDTYARRVFLFERWLDLYNAPEREIVVRTMDTAMAPTDPEVKFGDAQHLALNDDHGDSTGFGDHAQISALMRYATTGTEADHARLESWVAGAVMQWDASGMDGYVARFHYAGVTPGSPLANGYAMNPRDPNDTNAFDIPAAVLPKMPAYYQTGIDINGVHYDVRPTWEGHTSIDAISGSMNSWPLVYDHIRDPALRARMARHYGCFLKRLKIFKLINLSQNPDVQAAIAHYLAIGTLHQDADEPDLTKLDSIYGFYLPQYNNLSAATYPQACPDHLATDASADETIDATDPDFVSKLVLLILRQAETTDSVDSIDFSFFPSVRSGDAVMLLAYADGAYHMTGDPEYLAWRDQVLVAKAHADQIARTTGSLVLPKACRVYYRDPNVYTAQFMRTLLQADDGPARAESAHLWTAKFQAKEEAGLRDTLFALYSSGALGASTDSAADAVAEVLTYGGTQEVLDSPRRNYSTDRTLDPPAGVAIAPASAADLATCDTPITVLGITIPTSPADPNQLYSSPALSMMDRPPDNWIWEKDPFRAVKQNYDSGQQQYPGLDIIEPYWVARYFGYIPDSHLILAWGPTAEARVGR